MVKNEAVTVGACLLPAVCLSVCLSAAQLNYLRIYLGISKLRAD